MSTYLICGYGGIGRALSNTLRAQGHRVHVLSRQQDVTNATAHQIDISQPGQVNVLLKLLNEIKPNVVINTIGMLNSDAYNPEKHIQQLNLDWLSTSMQVNVYTSVQLAQALSSYMMRQTALKFMAFSARVSSIRDDKLGGWYSYRMTKCMLNMFIKNLSIEWQRQHPHAIACAYHPGTVDTALSRPFQANVPKEKLFTPEKAASHCLNVLDKITIDDTGCLIDWQGENIDW